MEKKWIAFLIILSTSFSAVYAHPFTEDTFPVQFSNVPAGTTEIIVKYSEGIEIGFSSLKVFDGNGNQVDNRDTKYYEGDYSLTVSTPPLQDGIYTVTSKVLSKVDGHLVDDAFIFGVGAAKIDEPLLERKGASELIFLPEAGARFPGYVGQTIVLGSVIASILIWGTQNKTTIQNQLGKFQEKFHGKFLSLTGIGLILVFVSNILMLIVQTIRLETSPLEAIQTSFGNTWLIRMAITIPLFGIWFWMERKKILSIRNQIPLLVLALGLIGTTTMMGHGAASEQYPAIVLDYIHNLVASIWIGGIIFFVFTLLPSFSSLDSDKREKISLVSIPRFSIAFIIALGVVIISGPTLMWFLESDVGLITESTYGKLILAKISIAAIMVALGGFLQIRIQRKAESDLKKGSISIHKPMQKALKIDVALGVILLGVVSLLANGTLPAGEIQDVSAQEIRYGYSATEFSENARFEIEINPFASGANAILVSATDFSGTKISDISGLKVKVSNPQRNIAPIEISMNPIENEDTKYTGEITFGFSGHWEIQVEAKRVENANESVVLDLFVKPRLSDLKPEIIEYEFPEEATPLFPAFDGHDSIWISDPLAPRLWKFSISEQEFKKYEFEGKTSITLAIDNQGKIWFTDIPQSSIGFLNPENQEIKIIKLPALEPANQNSIPISLVADSEDNIWISVTNKNVLLEYNQDEKTFQSFEIPTKDSGPFALALGNDGNIWFSESIAGKIGFIDVNTKEIKEYSPDEPLSAPEAIIFDEKDNLWVAEHTGIAVKKFNPILETFLTIPVPDQDALPFGMTFDRFGNLWFAQHTIDKLGVYDPDNENLIEVPIPTQGSFVQFTTSDRDHNVWFVEQKGNKLGMVKLTELPSIGTIVFEENQINLQYTEIASPLIAIGVIATSLFFVKAIQDKRRLNSLILE